MIDQEAASGALWLCYPSQSNSPVSAKNPTGFTDQVILIIQLLLGSEEWLDIP